ncbi:MAG: NUDIX hydrolase [Sedimenticola sp.]
MNNNKKLSVHQIEALDAYETLMITLPSLFTGRYARPIVRDRNVLDEYAAENGEVLGVASKTPYVLFIIDLVESRTLAGDIRRHPYLRIVSCAQLEGGVNVVILATIENPSLGEKGNIVLLEQERHAVGTKEVELPRGFGERGLSGELNALRELKEETGYVGDKAFHLGTICTDSGLTDSTVSFYHVPVTSRTELRPEMEEAISQVYLLSLDEVWNAIQLKRIRDGFTLQAVALYQKQVI